jgi:hypothetical protein
VHFLFIRIIWVWNELNQNKPDAYLVYIFFDKNLKVVKQKSGAIPVGDPDALAKLAKDWMVAISASKRL